MVVFVGAAVDDPCSDFPFGPTPINIYDDCTLFQVGSEALSKLRQAHARRTRQNAVNTKKVAAGLDAVEAKMRPLEEERRQLLAKLAVVEAK